MQKFQGKPVKRRFDVPPDVMVCNSCGEHFADEEAYDAHILLFNGFPVKCFTDEAEMRDEGLLLTAKRVWVLFD